MSIDARSMGSPRLEFQACLHALLSEFFLDRPSLESFDPSSVSSPASPSEFLRSLTRPNLSARALPAWVPSLFAASPDASTTREASDSSLRSALELSQLPGGFLRIRFHGLVSSRNHVQGSSVFREFSLDAARPSRRGSLPPCRYGSRPLACFRKRPGPSSSASRLSSASRSLPPSGD